MKKLNVFMQFNNEKFFKNKKLIFLDSKVDSKGLKANLMIVEDNLQIPNYESGTNEFEKFSVRVPESNKSVLESLKKRDKVELYDFEKSVIWGDYRENLTVYARIRKAN